MVVSADFTHGVLFLSVFDNFGLWAHIQLVFIELL